jgi:hypothetical protein
VSSSSRGAVSMAPDIYRFWESITRRASTHGDTCGSASTGRVPRFAALVWALEGPYFRSRWLIASDATGATQSHPFHPRNVAKYIRGLLSTPGREPPARQLHRAQSWS